MNRNQQLYEQFRQYGGRAYRQHLRNRRVSRLNESHILRIYYGASSKRPLANIGKNLMRWCERMFHYQWNIRGKCLSIYLFKRIIRNSGMTEEQIQFLFPQLTMNLRFFSNINRLKYLRRQRNLPRLQFLIFLDIQARRIMVNCIKRKIHEICEGQIQVTAWRDEQYNQEFRLLEEICQQLYPIQFAFFRDQVERRDREVERNRIARRH